MGRCFLGSQCARDGFRTGTTPEVGAIISWNDGALGHVAYVTAVNEEGQIKFLKPTIVGNSGWIISVAGLIPRIPSEKLPISIITRINDKNIIRMKVTLHLNVGSYFDIIVVYF